MLTLFFNRGLLQLFSHLSSPPLIFCNLDPFRYHTGTCFINRLVILSVISSGWTFRFAGDRQQLPRDFRQRKLVSMCYTICRFPPVDCYVETEEREIGFLDGQSQEYGLRLCIAVELNQKKLRKGRGLQSVRLFSEQWYSGLPHYLYPLSRPIFSVCLITATAYTKMLDVMRGV